MFKRGLNSDLKSSISLKFFPVTFSLINDFNENYRIPIFEFKQNKTNTVSF